MANLKFSFGVHVRPFRGTHRGGDIGLYRSLTEHSMLAAVIDIAGHGETAYRIAAPIENYLNRCDAADVLSVVDEIVALIAPGSHAALMIGILNSKCAEFSYVQIGDVHGALISRDSRRLVAQRGRVGLMKERPLVRNLRFVGRDAIVFCSDGLHQRADLREIAQYRTRTLTDLSHAMVTTYGKSYDDASCLIMRAEPA